MQEDSLRLGVALGGGAFRGLAHIGVLQALEAHGLAPCAIAGTSMGALVGGVYACGMNLRLMERFCASIDEKDLVDVALPTEGILAGNRIELLLRTLTGNRTFDQAKIPFAAVATDLELGKRAVLSEGLLYQAIRASISIPGIFKPYRLNGRTYVDGGVVDRVPVTTARAMGADFVLAVDVGYRGEPASCEGIAKVILHSLEIMEWQVMQHTISTADFTLVPALSHINPASIAQAEECIRIGREEAERRMPELLAALEQKREALSEELLPAQEN
ncbi:MAG: patatin-like phospholipase family protein [Candidatus Spyradocola sp.]|jgi:NTE family protein